MFVAAVLPAASELTMVYGGALASGALAGPIAPFHTGFHAYLAGVPTRGPGGAVGASWSHASHDLRYADYAVAAGIAALAAFVIWRRRRTARLSPREDSAR